MKRQVNCQICYSDDMEKVHMKITAIWEKRWGIKTKILKYWRLKYCSKNLSTQIKTDLGKIHMILSLCSQTNVRQNNFKSLQKKWVYKIYIKRVSLNLEVEMLLWESSKLDQLVKVNADSVQSSSYLIQVFCDHILRLQKQ